LLECSIIQQIAKDAEFYVPKENPGKGSSLFMLGMSQILQLIDARDQVVALRYH
jgi:hypothetical protein